MSPSGHLPSVSAYAKPAVLAVTAAASLQVAGARSGHLSYPLLASSSSPGLHCRLGAAPAASPDGEESRPESAA